MSRFLFLLVVCLAAFFCFREADPQSSDEAFEGFLDQLKAAGDVIVAGTPEGDGRERAEGFRHIIRLIEMQNAPAMDDHDEAPRI